METTSSVSPELMKKICDAIRPQEMYWDQGSRGEASVEDCLKAITSQDSRHEFYDDIYNHCMESVCDYEQDAMMEAVKEFEDDIMEELGIDEDDWDPEMFVEEHVHELRDFTSVDLCEHELLSTVNVRLELYSSFDCINSHWFESQGGFEYKDTYFRDAVDALNLNPALVKKMWVEKGLECRGRWPNRHWRNGKELVTYSDFYEEEVNRCSPACLLVILGQLDAQAMYKQGITLDDIESVTIPKGNVVGFYSGWEGGGSMMEAPLQRAMTITPDKELKGSKYDYWGLVIDGDRGYSIKEVYGTCDSIFEAELIINTKKQ
jgi:hypothetical protein